MSENSNTCLFTFEANICYHDYYIVYFANYIFKWWIHFTVNAISMATTLPAQYKNTYCTDIKNF